MNKTPPLLPEETLARLVRVARFDGLGMLFISGLFAISAGASGDRLGVFVGILASGAGAIELHGVNEIYRGRSRGVNWLLFSQAALLIIILAYCSYRFTHVDLTQIMLAIDNELTVKIEAAGMTVNDFARVVYFATYTLVSLVATIYSLVISIYYLRRRRAVETALAPET